MGEEASSDDVVAEVDIQLVVAGGDEKLGSIAHIQLQEFASDKWSPRPEDATVRIKPRSKRLQITRKRTRDDDLDDSARDVEKKDIQLEGGACPRHPPINRTVGYFEKGRLYLLPVADTFSMHYRRSANDECQRDEGKFARTSSSAPRHKNIPTAVSSAKHSETQQQNDSLEQDEQEEEVWVDMTVLSRREPINRDRVGPKLVKME